MSEPGPLPEDPHSWRLSHDTRQVVEPLSRVVGAFVQMVFFGAPGH